MVDLGILCQRLKLLGITETTGIWIHSFLHVRTQRVLANGKISTSFLASSGVPQGSVLGPLLFLCIIQSLPQVNLTTATWMSIFADDTGVGKPVRNIEDAEDF
jgi:ribonuclease P/MRP protein subunit RPP40